MNPGHAAVVLTKEKSTAIFKDVPALICDDCGEHHLDEATTADIYDRADRAFSSGQEVAISTFAVT
jgi:YgiT-type zinc finger domain-containing protein